MNKKEVIYLGLVYILMILTPLFWGGAFVAGKFSLVSFTPEMIVFLRFAMALPCIFMLLYALDRQNFIPKGKQWIGLGVGGLLGIFGYNYFFMLGLKYTSAINASMIVATFPAVTGILSYVLFKEPFTVRRAIGVLLAFLGVLLVASGGDISTIINKGINLGDGIMLIAVFSIAIYSVLSARFMIKYSISPLQMTAYSFLICTFITAPMVWTDLVEEQLLFMATPSAWWSIIYMAIFASVLAYWFQLIGIAQLGAPRAAIFINLVSVFAMILAAIILQEPVEIVKVVAMMIILGGVYLAAKK